MLRRPRNRSHQPGFIPEFTGVSAAVATTG